MILKENIKTLIEDYLAGNSLFLVDINISKDNDIEITIDSPERVDIENCAEINRIVCNEYDRDVEDYSLTVTSAGLDQPFKVFRQFVKFTGKEIEVIFKNGTKIVGTLSNAQPDSIEVTYSRLEKTEGQKRKTKVEVTQEIPLIDTKSVKPFINFK